MRLLVLAPHPDDFDERILEVNRRIAAACPGYQEFAEAFECAFWDRPPTGKTSYRIPDFL